MKKITQFEIGKQNEIIALTEDGDLYCGFFINPEFSKPEFGWRKIPSIPDIGECFVYKRMKEPTEAELAAAKKIAISLQRKNQ